MTLPNLITVLRLVLVPAIVVAMSGGHWAVAFVLFLAAGLSDAADGIIARRFDQRSLLGAYLDPLADKALLVSIYVSLSVTAVLPGWVAITVVSRDLMIVAAIMLSWVMDRPIAIQPLFVSKTNTAVQIGFAALVLGSLAFSVPLGALMPLGQAAVLALTVLSAAAYLALWLRHMAGA